MLTTRNACNNVSEMPSVIRCRARNTAVQLAAILLLCAHTVAAQPTPPLRQNCQNFEQVTVQPGQGILFSRQGLGTQQQQLPGEVTILNGNSLTKIVIPNGAMSCFFAAPDPASSYCLLGTTNAAVDRVGAGPINTPPFDLPACQVVAAQNLPFGCQIQQQIPIAPPNNAIVFSKQPAPHPNGEASVFNLNLVEDIIVPNGEDFCIVAAPDPAGIYCLFARNDLTITGVNAQVVQNPGGLPACQGGANVNVVNLPFSPTCRPQQAGPPPVQQILVNNPNNAILFWKQPAPQAANTARIQDLLNLNDIVIPNGRSFCIFAGAPPASSYCYIATNGIGLIQSVGGRAVQDPGGLPACQ